MLGVATENAMPDFDSAIVVSRDGRNTDEV